MTSKQYAKDRQYINFLGRLIGCGEEELAKALAHALGAMVTTGKLPDQTAAGNGPRAPPRRPGSPATPRRAKPAPAESKTVTPSPADDHAAGPRAAVREGGPPQSGPRR